MKHADLNEAGIYLCSGIVTFVAGRYNRLCFTYRHKDVPYYQLGCFNGMYKETVDAIRKKYGKDSSYEAIVTEYRGVV
jgi:hypothetical protein